MGDFSGLAAEHLGQHANGLDDIVGSVNPGNQDFQLVFFFLAPVSEGFGFKMRLNVADCHFQRIFKRGA